MITIYKRNTLCSEFTFFALRTYLNVLTLTMDHIDLTI